MSSLKKQTKKSLSLVPCEFNRKQPVVVSLRHQETFLVKLQVFVLTELLLLWLKADRAGSHHNTRLSPREQRRPGEGNGRFLLEHRVPIRLATSC